MVDAVRDGVAGVVDDRSQMVAQCATVTVATWDAVCDGVMDGGVTTFG